MKGVIITSKMKKVKRLVLKEELYKHKVLWLIFIISIGLSLWTNIESLKIHILESKEWADAANTLIQNLSYSIIAGTIIYIITEFVPNCTRRYDSLSSIADTVHMLYDSIKSVMSISCDKDVKYTDDFDVESFCKRFVSTDLSSQSFNDIITAEECDFEIMIRPEYLFALEMVIQRIDENLNALALLSSNMQQEEICMIPMVKSCSFFLDMKKRFCLRIVHNQDELCHRFGLLKHELYDYKFVRDGIMNLRKSYEDYITLENA